MTSLFALLLLGAVDTADARHRQAHPVRHHQHATTQPRHPPKARTKGHVYYHNRHWVFRHANSRLLWRWTAGHVSPRGKWIAGHWTVVIKF